MNNLIQFLIIIIGFFIIIVIFSLFSKFFSYLDGWHELAKKYKATREFMGEKFGFQSAYMGFIIGRSSYNFGANGKELLLGTNIFFRTGHPDLIIPLKIINGNQQGERVVLMIDGLRININKILADKIVKASKSNWQYIKD